MIKLAVDVVSLARRSAVLARGDRFLATRVTRVTLVAVGEAQVPLAATVRTWTESLNVARFTQVARVVATLTPALASALRAWSQPCRVVTGAFLAETGLATWALERILKVIRPTALLARPRLGVIREHVVPVRSPRRNRPGELLCTQRPFNGVEAALCGDLARFRAVDAHSEDAFGPYHLTPDVKIVLGQECQVVLRDFESVDESLKFLTTQESGDFVSRPRESRDGILGRVGKRLRKIEGIIIEGTAVGHFLLLFWCRPYGGA